MADYAINLEAERCPDGVEVVIRDEPPPEPVPEGSPFGLSAAVVKAIEAGEPLPPPRPVEWRSGEAAQAELEQLRERERQAEMLADALGGGPHVGWSGMSATPTGAHRWLRPRTERRAKVTLHAGQYTPPVVVRFINARGEKKLLDFLYAFGLPGENTEGEPLRRVEQNQAALERLLWLSQIGEQALAVRIFQDMAGPWITELRPQLTIPPRGDRPVLSLTPRTLLGYMLLEAGMMMGGNTRLMRCVHCSAVFISGAHGGKRKTAIYCSNRCRVAAQRAAAREAERASQGTESGARCDQDVTT